MAFQGEAFAPGHVTAFFVGYDDPDPLKKGSRGVGCCTTLGVHTVARLRESRTPSIEVFINDDRARAPTTERVAKLLLGDRGFEVKILQTVQLPISQGFGMSGAGALSTALALGDALDLRLSREDLVAIAHRADVEAGTGLGDVVPQATGGMDLRVRPGAPPHGAVKRLPVDAELLLCSVGPPFVKGTVLGNPRMMETIRAVGLRCLEKFEQDPSFEAMFDLGRSFAVDTGLAAPRIRECVDAVRAYGRATMSMLGHSVFAVGGKLAATVLRSYGTVYRCAVDNEGARVL